MPDTNYEHIELYLNEEMSPEERHDFQQRLKQDNVLQEQLRQYKEVNGILSRRMNLPKDEQRLREQLQEKRSQYFSQDSKIVPFTSHRKKWYAIASVAAVALILITLWAPWQQDTLGRYGHIQMITSTVRGNEQNAGKTKAAQLFNDKKYEQALPLLDSLVQINPSDARSRFYRGVTLLHLHREAKAREELNIIYKGQSIYQYNAAYFIALSYLQKNNKDSCRYWLQRIPKDAAVYPKAEKVWKKIGK